LLDGPHPIFVYKCLSDFVFMFFAVGGSGFLPTTDH